MIFQLRTGNISLLSMNPDTIMREVLDAVRTRAEVITNEYKSRIVASIYAVVHRQTGAIEKAIKPFVMTNSNVVTLGFDFDLAVAPHLLTQIMITRNSSAYTVIKARGNMLTIPLEEKLHGKSVHDDPSLKFIHTKNNSFFGHKSGRGAFVPDFVLKRTVKVLKRVRMYDIMEMFERDARVELNNVAQSTLNRIIKGR